MFYPKPEVPKSETEQIPKDTPKKITQPFCLKNLLVLGLTSLFLYLAPMLLPKASAQSLNKANLEKTLNKANPTNSFTQVDTAWVRRYNGPGNDYDEGTSLAVDGQGNVYVTGYSTGSGTSLDYATIKYDSAGVQKWVQRYNGPGNGDDWASSLAVDGQGNVYVTGGDYGLGTNSDYATIKYDSTGVQKWVQRYNGPASSLDAAYSLAVDGQGNAYVTGESYAPGAESDCVTIKYDSAGVQKWLQRYNGPASSIDYGRSLAVDGRGNAYVTGVSMVVSTQCDFVTIKYDSLGVQEWVQSYNGPGNAGDFAFSIALDGQGNAYVTGDVSDTTDDCATIKYNSAGVQEWVQIYNGPANNGDYSRSIALDGQGNAYVTGWSIISDTSDDYLTIKYNSAGVEQWVQTYTGVSGNGENHSWPLAVDGQGNVYVSGYSYGGSGTQCDYATIKYIQETGIQEKPSERGRLKNILQTYPNPVKDIATIRYSLAKPSHVNLNLYNSAGQKVETLVDKLEGAGNRTLSLNTKNIASGVYFYVLTSGEKSTSKKIVIIH
jgi:hypothetical protein